MTLRIVAHFKTRPDKMDQARELLESLIAPTHNEPGCISYELLEGTEDPTQLTFVEEWRDEADLEAHFGTDHVLAALEQLDELMAEPLDLRRYRKVG